MGLRTKLMPMPALWSNSEFITAGSDDAGTILFFMSQAEESVNDAPKPSMVWERSASFMKTAGTDTDVPLANEIAD